MKTEDLRGKIACLVGSIGWEKAEESLNPHEKLTLTMVKNWLHFTLAEEWVRVRDSLVGDAIKPISADGLLVGSYLKESFENALALGSEQGSLYEEKERSIAQEEENFFDSILLQRDQEIHQLQIKKKASMPKSLAKRKAEKEAKAAMLAKSVVREAQPAEANVAVKVLDDTAN